MKISELKLNEVTSIDIKKVTDLLMNFVKAQLDEADATNKLSLIYQHLGGTLKYNSTKELINAIVDMLKRNQCTYEDVEQAIGIDNE